jgi:hypothetical protein
MRFRASEVKKIVLEIMEHLQGLGVVALQRSEVTLRWAMGDLLTMKRWIRATWHKKGQELDLHFH